MNLLFGAAGSAVLSFSETSIRDYLQSCFDQTPEIIRERHPQTTVGLLSDGGVILGKAQSEKASVYLLGSLNHPLPDWTSPGSPLDDPDRTAAYLLDQYTSTGESFLNDVTGQYSLLLLDHQRQATYLATDPMGMRTWYLAEKEDGLRFSTHLRTLADMLGSELTIDRSQEDFFLIHGFHPHGGTPYKGVYSMPGGELLCLEANGYRRHKIRYQNPWRGRPGFETGDITSTDVLTERLYDAFMAALEEQSADDLRAAVLLGGFDSALVASALQRLGKKVETFSFSYHESEYNQPHTDTLSEYLGTPHHWVQITQDIFREGLENFSCGFNQPTNWPNYVIQTAHLAKIMRESGFRYCYSGDGCDTVFLGYPGTYRRARLLESFPTLPTRLVELLVRLFGRDILERRLGHPYRVFLNLLRSLGREMPARGFVSFRIMDEVGLRQLRRGAAPKQGIGVEQLLRDLAEPHRHLPTMRLAYQGKSMVSPNKNKMVGSSDQNGIAIFSPYLHPGLKAFALDLPENLCRPDEETTSSVTGKYVLMKMAEEKKLLPPEVIYQPKVAGVDGPIDDWYAAPLNEVIMNILKGLPFDADQKYLQQLARPKLAEDLFKSKVMVDKVISHALSLLITYASFTDVRTGGRSLQ